METKGIDQVLAQLRTTAASAAGKPVPGAEGDFSAALKAAIDQVNQAQQEGAKLSEKFAAGDNETNLHEVMLSLQKANVSFQEMIQVRNRLVSAYQDIMNMQV